MHLGLLENSLGAPRDSKGVLVKSLRAPGPTVEDCGKITIFFQKTAGASVNSCWYILFNGFSNSCIGFELAAMNLCIDIAIHIHMVCVDLLQAVLGSNLRHTRRCQLREFEDALVEAM